MVNRRHWTRLVLVLSLGANLVVAGMAIGHFSRGGLDRAAPLIWALGDLDQHTRDRLKPILRENFQATREARKALRSASRDIQKVVSEEPLDAAKLANSLARMRELSGQYQAQIHQRAIATLQEIPPDQRARFVGRLLRSEPPPRRHGPPRNGMPPPNEGPSARNTGPPPRD